MDKVAATLEWWRMDLFKSWHRLNALTLLALAYPFSRNRPRSGKFSDSFPSASAFFVKVRRAHDASSGSTHNQANGPKTNWARISTSMARNAPGAEHFSGTAPVIITRAWLQSALTAGFAEILCGKGEYRLKYET